MSSHWPAQFCDETFGVDAAVALMRGDVAAIVVRDFMKPRAIQAMLAAIDKVGIEYYVGDDKGGSASRKGKIGPNFFRFRDQPEKYFALADRFRPIFAKQIFANDQPVDRLMRCASAAFNLPARGAAEGGKPLMFCTIRDLSSAPIHSDWLPRECPNLDFSRTFSEQLAWNVYLRLSQTGGETVIYRHDARTGPLIASAPCMRLRVPAGALVLFRSTNFHSVEAADGPRITLSGFCGKSADQLTFYV